MWWWSQKLWPLACGYGDVMKPLRRSIVAMVFPVLLAAGLVGCALTPREDDAPAAKLTEDLTEDVKKAVAAALDGELEHFYQAAGFAPVWKDRREEVVAALMTARARGLKPEDYLGGVDSASDTVAADLALTKGLMRYAHDVRFGRGNPGIYGKAEAAPSDEMARAIAQDAAGLEAGLRKLDPPFAEYKRLEAALTQYRQKADSDVGASEQVRQIELTMERWRWLPRSFDHGAIFVNIPEFHLRALDQNNNVALEMKVIVGLATNPTPLFTANLKHLIFAPYWNVPRSILLNEILRDIRKDRSYLARNKYEVVNAERHVVSTGDVSDETLAGLKSGEFQVRQVPGPKNALGRVKFMFPNNFDVYMHDTPTRSLFEKEQRAFSHGCVRLENPQALAEWVLREEPDWSKERIEASLQLTRPLQSKLKTAIPVFLLYHTVTVSDDGAVHFWKDLYKQDAALAEKLAATTAEPGPRPRE